eukprot:CAMPEP_0185841394 /NCGR_PEP_ID=MMETSP1353-20130828/17835_1 /TAXON_ID=1077150 /ORGANISM="Erythrolobus australicus, Strain CCMP3124" /LENGTH=43 /DNA_ID= /DNA_START= /DNA_END= /DNA_ORIENTATION=
MAVLLLRAKRRRSSAFCDAALRRVRAARVDLNRTESASKPWHD